MADGEKCLGRELSVPRDLATVASARPVRNRDEHQMALIERGGGPRGPDGRDAADGPLTGSEPRLAGPSSRARVGAAVTASDGRLVFGDLFVALLVPALTLAVALGVHGWGREVLGLCFAFFAPGWSVLRLWRSLDLTSRLVLSIAVSLSVCILVPTVELFVNWWHPLTTYYYLAIATWAPALFKAGGVFMGRWRGRWLPAGTGPEPRAVLVRELRRWLSIASVRSAWPIGLSLCAWALSMALSNLRKANGSLGLLPALPPLYYVSLAVLVIYVAWQLRLPGTRPRHMRLCLFSLVAIVQGPMIVLYPGPRYFWDFKAVGEASLVDTHGGLDLGLDIYQRWPGFAGLTAFFTHLAGTPDAVGVLKWAPVTFDILFLVGLSYALHGLPLTEKERWLALFVAYGADWALNGQDILAPQAVGLFMSLVILGMVLRWFGGRPRAPRHRPFSKSRSSLWYAALSPSIPWNGAPTAGWTAKVAVLGVYAALVVTHPLSCFVVLLEIGLLMVLNRVRPVWLVADLAGMAAAYLLPNLKFLEKTAHLLGGLGNVFANAAPPVVGAHAHLGPNRVVLVGLTLLVYGLAGIGLLRKYRSGEEVLVFVALAAAPLSLVALVHYGSETSYRSILFSSPWAASLVPSALRPRSGRVRHAVTEGAVGKARAATIAVVMMAVTGLFVVSNDSQNEIYEVAPTDIAAATWLYGSAPPGVLLTVNGFFPLRLGARYDQFLGVSQGDDSLGRLAYDDASVATIDEYACSIEFGNERRVYVALTTAQEVGAIDSGDAGTDFLPALKGELLGASGWNVVFQNKTATIFEYDGRC